MGWNINEQNSNLRCWPSGFDISPRASGLKQKGLVSLLPISGTITLLSPSPPFLHLKKIEGEALQSWNQKKKVRSLLTRLTLCRGRAGQEAWRVSFGQSNPHPSALHRITRCRGSGPACPGLLQKCLELNWCSSGQPLGNVIMKSGWQLFKRKRAMRRGSFLHLLLHPSPMKPKGDLMGSEQHPPPSSESGVCLYLKVTTWPKIIRGKDNNPRYTETEPPA